MGLTAKRPVVWLAVECLASIEGMRATTVGAMSALAIALAAAPAIASDPWPVEVFQPLDIENVVHVSRVTYVTYDEGDPGELAVAMTCDSNCVISYGARNWNVAFTAGLKVRVEYNPRTQSSLFGDTLRVVLDTRGLAAGERRSDWSGATILEATTECIMANAAISPAVRVVDLRIEGDPKYASSAGIRSTRTFRAGPRRRDFK